jgi:hypothetical protein
MGGQQVGNAAGAGDAGGAVDVGVVVGGPVAV